MGCSASKVDDHPLVVLCRERRDLIRSAADLRFALSSSHASYFHALDSTSSALHRFLQEEFTALSTPSSSSVAPSSPVLTIPSSEGKPQKSKSASAAISSGTVGEGGTSSSPSSLTHSFSLEDSNLHIASDSDTEEIPGEGFGKEPSLQSSPVNRGPYYSMWQSSTIPTRVYEAPYADYGYSTDYGMQEGNTGDPSSYYFQENRMPTAPPPRAPPTPPPPEPSPWDFLNPFEFSEQLYSSRRYGSAPSSPNSSDVREREGIPDLEEETESESMRELTREKRMRAKNSRKKVPGPDGSKSVRMREKNVAGLEEKGSMSSSDGSFVRSFIGSGSFRGSVDGSASKSSERVSRTITEEDERKKEVSFGLKTSVPTEKSGPNLETGLSAQDTGVTEVAKEIKEQFRLATISGDEVSDMLEVGLPYYRTGNAIHRVISSRISDAFCMLTYSCASFKHAHNSTADSLKFAKAWYGDSGNRMDTRCGNLSSTLEKLSVWEKKLYKEVKEEEKLRILYEKQSKRLKTLDEIGAESQKIDAARASIIRLVTKIDIAMKSVDAISRRIHKLRDEELQPQITELIQRSIVMWKCMLDCHQKQFMAIIRCKSGKLRTKAGSTQRGGAAKITRDLEVELVNWMCCFSDWINIQRHCFFVLNEWLRRCICVEMDETPDGVPPYSPGRFGAPPAFVICNDLCEAMKKVSEEEVTVAMEDCAGKVRALWETQGEVQRQKQRAEYLSKDLAKRLRSLQKEGGVGDSAVSFAATMGGGGGGGGSGSLAAAVELMRKILEEEKFRHQEALKRVKHVARSSLREGLIPVFHELGNFAVEILNAYEKVRIPRGGRENS